MKPHPSIISVALWAAGALLPGTVAAQGIDFHAIAPGKITISGHATLGDWQCETRRFEVEVAPGLGLQDILRYLAPAAQEIVPKTAAAATGASSAKPAEARATIVVSTLDCANRPMRADLLRALKAADFPRITYVFKKVDAVTPVKAPGETQCHLHLVTFGSLELAGVERPVQVLVDIWRTGIARFRLKATTTLQMRDFGIAPPTALFGLIKAGDTVTISGDMTLAPDDNQP